jgi:hypothetical protein
MSPILQNALKRPREVTVAEVTEGQLLDLIVMSGHVSLHPDLQLKNDFPAFEKELLAGPGGARL